MRIVGNSIGNDDGKVDGMGIEIPAPELFSAT
jgi:hypothetical protein